MTEISFHFNAPDKLGHACRLLRKADNAGHQVVVVGPDATLRQLDASLWTFSALDFVPHCFADAAPSVLKNSTRCGEDTEEKKDTEENILPQRHRGHGVRENQNFFLFLFRSAISA